MLSETQFYEEIQKNALRYMDKSLYNSKTQVILDDTCRNHITVKGFALKDDKTVTAPHIYLDGLYAWYVQNNIDFDDVLKQIAEGYKQAASMFENTDVWIEKMHNFQEVKSRIYPRLTGKVKNQRYLEDKVYTTMSNLAILYHVEISQRKNQKLGYSVVVSHSMLEQFGITKQTLHETAINNMLSSDTRVFMSLAEFISINEDVPQEFSEEMGMDNPLWILSDFEHSYGAARILDKGFMRKVARVWNDDVIIFPSSQDEVLLIAERHIKGNVKWFQDMVKYINATYLPAVDKISDDLYIFDASESKIKVYR